MVLERRGSTAIDLLAGASEMATAPVVLLVEDEVLLRVTTADELRDRSHVVIEAANADEAIRTLQSKVPVHVVLSDIRMPGEKDGVALAYWIHEHHPNLAVILVSGDTPPVISVGVTEAFFPKPYVVSDVAERIASALVKQRAP
jgi:DNA-binding NtrC family response regulator